MNQEQSMAGEQSMTRQSSNRSRMIRRWLLRSAGIFVLALPLMGPSPGYVSGCDATSSEYRGFCVDREAAICDREAYVFSGDSAAFLEQCRSGISERCNGAWPDGCLPTMELTTNCINALRDLSRVNEPTPSIAECNVDQILCGGAAATLISTNEVSP